MARFSPTVQLQLSIQIFRKCYGQIDGRVFMLRYCSDLIHSYPTHSGGGS